MFALVYVLLLVVLFFASFYFGAYMERRNDTVSKRVSKAVDNLHK